MQWTVTKKKSLETDLSFGYDLNGHRLSFHLPFLGLSPASMTEMPSPHLLPQLVLPFEVLPEPEVLVQQPLSSSSDVHVLRDRLRRSGCPPSQSRHDRFGGRRRRKRPFELSSRSSRRRRRYSRRQRALKRANVVGVDLGGERRLRSGSMAVILGRLIGSLGDLVVLDGGDVPAVAVAHGRWMWTFKLTDRSESEHRTVRSRSCTVFLFILLF